MRAAVRFCILYHSADEKKKRERARTFDERLSSSPGEVSNHVELIEDVVKTLASQRWTGTILSVTERVR